jgi:hypothetical protein
MPTSSQTLPKLRLGFPGYSRKAQAITQMFFIRHLSTLRPGTVRCKFGPGGHSFSTFISPVGGNGLLLVATRQVPK